MNEKLSEELKKIQEEGMELLKKIKDSRAKFIMDYQNWYTKSLRVVEQILPDRYHEFVLQYINEKRKEISCSTYTISDFCLGTMVTKYDGSEAFESKDVAYAKLLIQISIVKSISERLNNIISDIKGLLETEIFDSEIDSAKNLLKKGYLRASGAICGVILEKHFSEIAINHNLSLIKKDPTICDYNELFKREAVYDIPTFRHIQLLGDLRNLCDHDKKLEPTKDQINDLINGTEKIIKTTF